MGVSGTIGKIASYLGVRTKAVLHLKIPNVVQY